MSEARWTEESCITCSDQLLEVVVTAVGDDGLSARATCAGVPCEVSIELLDDVRVGEHLLVHGGVALQRGEPEVTR